MPAFQNRTSWHLGLSAYWFATSFKWFIILLVLLPGQVKEIVPGGDKSSYWGMIFAIGATWAMIGPSIFGFITDRMVHKPGARGYFLLAGAALTLLALFVISDAKSIFALTFGYLLLQFADDVGTGPYAASIPELVPAEHRGRASGFMGLCTCLGQVVVALSAMLLGSRDKIYDAIAIVTVLGAVITFLTMRGATPVNPIKEPTRSTNLFGDFFKGWLEPWKHRDFVWVWFTRMLNALGYYIVATYLLYFLGDLVKVYDLGFAKFDSDSQAAQIIALVIAILGIAGGYYASRISDRVGRKKVIITAGKLMSPVLIPIIIYPNFMLIVILAAVFGFGYGMYISADWALASDVMPSKESYGKDMGIWAMSNTSVQILAGSLGFLITQLNRVNNGLGYQSAFFVAAVCFLISTTLIRRVKGSS